MVQRVKPPLMLASVQVPQLSIQFLANASRETVGDTPGVCALPLMLGTRMDFQAPGFSLALP